MRTCWSLRQMKKKSRPWQNLNYLLCSGKLNRIPLNWNKLDKRGSVKAYLHLMNALKSYIFWLDYLWIDSLSKTRTIKNQIWLGIRADSESNAWKEVCYHNEMRILFSMEDSPRMNLAISALWASPMLNLGSIIFSSGPQCTARHSEGLWSQSDKTHL